MTKYYPDSWVIIKFTSAKRVYHKLFAGWYGGFTIGESWKMNSGITKVEALDDGSYDIHGYSGSVYNVHPVDERMTGYMSNLLHEWCKVWNEKLNIKAEIVDFNPKEDYSEKETTD